MATPLKVSALVFCFMVYRFWLVVVGLPSGRRGAVDVRAAYWPSFDSFPAASIETSYFTHIYYAFLHPDPKTFELVLTPLDKKKLPELIAGLRADKSIRTVLSIGGGDSSDPPVLAKLSRSRGGRRAFIRSTIKVAREYGFDGLDLDWEFPENAGEMSDLGSLIVQWRKALEKEARVTGKLRLTLSSAVYYSSKFTTYGLPRSYPGEVLGKYLDWVSPMCFDYHGSWANFTGANAALYDRNSNISTESGVGSWIAGGVPAGKIVMGLPMYGHTWTLQHPNLNHIGAPATGPGPGDGTLTYNQVIEFNTKNKATVKYDKTSVSFYSYVGTTWIGYDDVPSIESKVQFAKARGLGGYFFWALGQDLNWAISKAAANAWGK